MRKVFLFAGGFTQEFPDRTQKVGLYFEQLNGAEPFKITGDYVEARVVNPRLEKALGVLLEQCSRYVNDTHCDSDSVTYQRIGDALREYKKVEAE